MTFQTQVNQTQAIAVEGDFASANPYYTVYAEQGAFVAGAAGVTLARWCWADANNITVANAGTGAPTGFLGRAGNIGRPLITQYLATAGNLIPAGFEVTLFKSAPVYVRNAGGSAVTIGMKAFANNSNGTTSFAAAGATVSGSTETKFYAESFGNAGDLIVISPVQLG